MGMGDAMRFIDLYDADTQVYTIFTPAERLTKAGYNLYGIPVEFEIASLGELERRELNVFSDTPALHNAATEALRLIEQYAEFFCEEDYDPIVDHSRPLATSGGAK